MRVFKKIGFSLAEVLVTMGILGTLTAMLLPTIQSIQPNQNKILLRKGYNVVERTVNILINDDSLYPTEDAFADATYGGPQRFCQNFQDSLNMITMGTCPASGTAYIGTTPDGIDWYYQAAVFTKSPNVFNNVVAFDVNGSANQPNCSVVSALMTYSKCASGKKPDLFKVGVRWDGKLHMGGTQTESDPYATEVLSSVTNNLNDK